MTEADSKLLILGDSVILHDLPGVTHFGTVLLTSKAGVQIEWDDKRVGWVDHRGMANIVFDGPDFEMDNRRKRTKRRPTGVPPCDT